MNARLIIDLGNSETRAVLLYDKVKGEPFKSKRFNFSNRFGYVDQGYQPSVNYTEDTSTIFQVTGKLDGEPVDEFLYSNGELQEKEHNIAPLRPTSAEKKYNSVTTILSYELCLIRATEYLLNEKSDEGITAEDISWQVTLLLPPGDVELGTPKAISMIKSIKHIDCLFPEMSFDVKLKKVSVLQEGFCAYIGTVFDRGQKLRTKFKYLLGETTLVLDIGAGTTDFLVVKDNKIIESTRHSIPRGGNNVLQIVRRKLRMELNGLDLPETVLMEGIMTGKVKDGARLVDITRFIDEAKDEVAKFLVQDTKAYFEEIEYPVRTIGRLICCGGGAVGINEGSTTKALSEAVIGYLRKLSPYIELVELPKNSDGEDISPRDLNVLGGSILAEAM